MRKFLSVCLAVLVPSIATPQYHNTEIVISQKHSVSYAALNKDTKSQVECLAQNIYFEANKEPYQGQLAVALVTLRRVGSENYPNSICGVVRQKKLDTCQFSWWCEAHKKYKAINYKYSEHEKQAYNEVRKVALYAYLNFEDIKDPTKGALFYHANYVDPKWKLTKTAVIGNHIFYKH